MAIPHAVSAWHQFMLPPPALVSQSADDEGPALHNAGRRIVHIEPANGATVGERRPEISATFVRVVNPARVQIDLDGRDVTPGSFIGRHAFAYQPATALGVGKHTITVTIGGHAHTAWSFTVGDAVLENALNGLLPVNGSRVGADFEVTGYTRRGAHVRVLATWNATSQTFSEGEESIVADATADSRGYFVAHIVAADPGARLVDVRIQATAPDGSVAVRTLRLRTGETRP